MWLLLAFVLACSPGPSDKVVGVEADDELMTKAIAEARATVDEFIGALEGQDPGDESFTVKVPVRDGDEVEHFWLSNVSYADGEFTGAIDNDPQFVSNVRVGQQYSVAKEGISDWMYFHDGVAIGNRTLRAMFPRMPEEEVAALEEMLGWD
jgi:uncharacterized protein YegJ (DUF2314 family)